MRQKYVILSCTFFSIGIVHSIRTGWSSLKPQLSNNLLSFSTADLGHLDMAILIATALSLTLFGRRLGRTNTKLFLIAGMAWIASCAFSMAISLKIGVTSFSVYLIFYVLMGLGNCTVWPACLSFLSQCVNESNTMLLGIWHSTTQFGDLLALAFSGFIASLKLESSNYCFALLSFLALLLFLQIFINHRYLPSDCQAPLKSDQLSNSLEQPDENTVQEIIGRREIILPPSETSKASSLTKHHGLRDLTLPSLQESCTGSEGNLINQEAEENQKPDTKKEIGQSKEVIVIDGQDQGDLKIEENYDGREPKECQNGEEEKSQTLKRSQSKRINCVNIWGIERVNTYVVVYAFVKAVNKIIVNWLVFYLSLIDFEDKAFIITMIWSLGVFLGGLIGALFNPRLSNAVFAGCLFVSSLLFMSLESIYETGTHSSLAIVFLVCGMIFGGPYNLIGTAIPLRLGQSLHIKQYEDALPAVSAVMEGYAQICGAISMLLIPKIGVANLHWIPCVMCFLSSALLLYQHLHSATVSSNPSPASQSLQPTNLTN